MPDLQRVLIVDDDPRVRAMLRRYLLEEGFLVSEAAAGAAMRDVLARDRVDLVLLDVVMPGEDGLSLARLIRRHSQVPIIMLTGKGDLIDRVAGLETGADDYIAKPFHLREVLARIRTVLRRSSPSSLSTPPPADSSPDVLMFDAWRLDLARRELRRPDDAPVALTTGEFDLLRVFALHPNRALSRDQLMDLVKGRDWSAFDRTVDTQIVRLRRKIEADPANPRLIKTVRGLGYIFVAAVTRA